jgi:hypothetical protein
MHFNKRYLGKKILLGENLLRCTIRQKGPNPYYTIFLFYILNPHKKIMNQKLSKFLKGLYFRSLQF